MSSGNPQQPAFFAAFFRKLRLEAIADPEPERFTDSWRAWQLRHFEREAFQNELREARALTTTDDDPAPLAREGLAAFLEWSGRQETRRRRRRGSVAA